MNLDIKCPMCGSKDVEITNHYEDWIFECQDCKHTETVNTEEWLDRLFPEWFE